jgi:integrase
VGSSKGSVKAPPYAWITRIDAVMRAEFGVSVEFLLERDATLAEWYALDLEPSALLRNIDEADIVLARWLAQFGDSTWRTYERALRRLARDMALSVAPTARSLLKRAARHPDAVARLVAAYVARGTATTGTLRLRLTALRRAMRALLAAGLAKPFDVQSPTDADVDLRIPNREDIDTIDARLMRAADRDVLAARTRAELLLAADGLRAHELIALRVEDVRLSSVVVDDEVVQISPRTGEALRAWLSLRGSDPGPLFVAFESKLRSIGQAPLSTRALERDIHRASEGLVTLRALRRYAVVAAVRERGWFSGERVARLTRITGVTRVVAAARASKQRAT